MNKLERVKSALTAEDLELLIDVVAEVFRDTKRDDLKGVYTQLEEKLKLDLLWRRKR